MISILLVDDHETVRVAIAAALGSHGNFSVVGAAGTPADAVEQARALKPNLVVTEAVLADGSAIDAGRQILAENPGMRVMALTSCQDQPIVRQAMDAGFSGYVLKLSPFNQFIEAIRAVDAGQMFLSPQVVSAVVAGGAAPVQSPANISDRERQVLQLVAHGMSTKEIADRLAISLKTVETHRRRVMSKLKLCGIAQLTKYAIREGLTTV